MSLCQRVEVEALLSVTIASCFHKSESCQVVCQPPLRFQRLPHGAGGKTTGMALVWPWYDPQLTFGGGGGGLMTVVLIDKQIIKVRLFDCCEDNSSQMRK